MTGRTVYVYRDGKVVPKDDQKLKELEPIGVDAPAFDWRYLQHEMCKQLAVPKELVYGKRQDPSGSFVLCFGYIVGTSPRARIHLEEPASLDPSSE